MNGVAAIVRGVGQVIFLPGLLSGVILLVGFAWADFRLALAAVAGAGLGAFTAWALRRQVSEIIAGLWGFNGVLVAMAVPVDGLATGALVALGVMATVPLGIGLRRLLGRRSAYTLPFILVTWALFWGLRPVASAGEGTPWAAGLLGLSQIFLIEHAITGGAVVLALVVHQPRWAALALLGSLGGWALGLLWDPLAAVRGLYGFNGALAALAIGGNRLEYRALGWVVLAIVLATVLTPVVAGLVAPVGLPGLTLPFVLATWGVQLSRDHPPPAGRSAPRRGSPDRGSGRSAPAKTQ